MKLKYYCSLLLFLSLNVYAQNAKFEISPYLSGVTSIKDGMFEAGAEFRSKSLIIRPYFRLPLTDKKNSLTQIDRFAETWRSVIAVEYIKDTTKDSEYIQRFMGTFQGEWGYSNFKFCPTGKKTEESSEAKNSFACEIKLVWFRSQGKPSAKQFSPQIRVRYSNEWKSSDEVGVVSSPNSSGVTYTTNMVIDKPTSLPIFSPAFSFQYYPGNGKLSYAPTVYFDLNGKINSYNPFNNLGRIRIELWTFYYPIVKGTPNIQIGVAPFFSIRTFGKDNLRQVEYGGQISFRVGATFLQFF